MSGTASDAGGFKHPVDREYYRRTWNRLVDRWKKHGLSDLEALERQLERVKKRFLNGESVAPSTLRNAMLMKALEDGTFGELSEVEKPSDVEEILATAEEGVHVTDRYIFAQQLDRIDVRLELTRVMIWFNIQGGEAPDWEDMSEEIQDEITRGQSHHARTVQIGRALSEYRNEHGHLPETDNDGRPFFGSKEEFKKWAGNVIERGPSTAYTALQETGCWPVSRQGASSGLVEAIEQCIRYARQHSGDLKSAS